MKGEPSEEGTLRMLFIISMGRKEGSMEERKGGRMGGRKEKRKEGRKGRRKEGKKD